MKIKKEAKAKQKQRKSKKAKKSKKMQKKKAKRKKSKSKKSKWGIVSPPPRCVHNKWTTSKMSRTQEKYSNKSQQIFQSNTSDQMSLFCKIFKTEFAERDKCLNQQ